MSCHSSECWKITVLLLLYPIILLFLDFLLKTYEGHESLTVRNNMTTTYLPKIWHIIISLASPITSVFETFTMDGIAKCAFGLQVDSQNNANDPFVKNAREIVGGEIFSPLVMLAGQY